VLFRSEGVFCSSVPANTVKETPFLPWTLTSF